MSVRYQDLLFYFGGKAIDRTGTLMLRTAPAFRNGEQQVETFSCDDAGTYITPDDLVLPVASATPRVSWYDLDSDGVRETPVYMGEVGRTTVLLQSEDFATTWSTSNCTVSANDVEGADGASTADKLVEDGTSSAKGVTQTMTLANDTNYCLSVFAAADERGFLRLETTDKNNDTIETFFNLSTGAVGTTGSGHTAAITGPYGPNGTLYRCSVVFDSDSGGTTPACEVGLCAADNTASYQGDSSSGIHVWGAMCHPGDGPTSYFATAGSGVTRDDDQISYSYFGPLTDFQVYSKFIELGGLQINGGSLWLIGTSGSGYYELLANATPTYSVVGNGTGIGATVTPVHGDTVEVLATFNADGTHTAQTSVNGAASSSASGSYTVPTALGSQNVYFGHDGSTDHGSQGHVAHIAARGVNGTMDDFRSWA